MKSPLRLGRFERRVLAAIAAVAFVPLVGALVFGRGVLGEVYRIGVNGRVQRQLDDGLVVQREHLASLRRDADLHADALAADHELAIALDAHDSSRARARLERAIERVGSPAFSATIERAGLVVASASRDVPADSRTLELVRDLPVPEHVLRVRVAAPNAPFQAYDRAGETAEVMRHLQASAGYVSGFYLVVYIALLLCVAVVALAIGIVVSRRVTRRIVVLADATQRVGAGDLGVVVPTDAKDEVGELSRAFNAMVRDIRASRDRIEYLQRVAAWQEMARRLAHEIKNPLTPIQLAVQELEQSYRGDDARFRRVLADARDIVEEEVRTLRRLVSEFSEFARLPEPALEPSELGAFVRDACRAIDPAALVDEGGAGPRNVRVPTLALEIENGPLPVRLDASLMRRCVDNLVRNAVQAIAGAREPTGPGRVIVAARRERDQVVLEVRDDGPGVSPELRERVFDPYYTTRDEGTGLGLAIVKKAVLDHGGTIACVEAPEGGAALQVRLPLDRGSART